MEAHDEQTFPPGHLAKEGFFGLSISQGIVWAVSILLGVWREPLQKRLVCGAIVFSCHRAFLSACFPDIVLSCHFTFLSSCFSVVTLSCHRAFLLSCFPVIVLSCRRVFLSSCFSVILLSCHRVFLSSCFPAVMLSCHRAFLPSCFPVIVFSCPSTSRVKGRKHEANFRRAFWAILACWSTY